MTDSFRQAYAALTGFIARHPEIEIGESVTSIPENVRPDFYALFNAARRAFVEDRFPECLSKAGNLQSEYAGVAEEAAGWMSLEEVPVVNKCRRFLCDSRDCLTRELFDPLFELLKKKVDRKGFERKACEAIDAFFPVVFRDGYERWTVLALAKMLEVKKAFRVPVRDLHAGDRAKSAAVAPAEDVPSPVESAAFLFSQSSKAIFSVPDFIIFSGRLNRFVGIRSEFKEGIYHALNACQAREWLPVTPEMLGMLDNGPTLVYLSDDPGDIALVGDVGKFCRPDLVLWCVDSSSITRKKALERVKLADGCFRPARGSFIIANDAWQEDGEEDDLRVAGPQAQGEHSRIRILTAGFNGEKLDPVIVVLGGTA